MPASQSRFRPISEHYRRRFGCKVYKVGLSTARTCPNRAGVRGMQVCTFCDEWGSAAYPERRELSVAGQLRENAARIRQRYGAQKFLGYFQAYTTPFDNFARIERLFAEALAQPDVVGLVLGTRPDCLPPRLLGLLAGLARDVYVSVEVGVQSLDDRQLAWLSRGHDSACSLAALETLRRTPGIETCAHLMFGLPGETDAQLQETAERLSRAGVHGVKLHNLHVLRNTPLAAEYAAGAFAPLELAEYAHRVAVFLERLAPGIYVHRLSAVASRWDDVLAPDWVRHKLGPAQAIAEHLEQVDTWQGKHYRGPHGNIPRSPESSRAIWA